MSLSGGNECTCTGTLAREICWATCFVHRLNRKSGDICRLVQGFRFHGHKHYSAVFHTERTAPVFSAVLWDLGQMGSTQ
jgi:hypothetical protein